MLTRLLDRFRTAPSRPHRSLSRRKQSCRLRIESLDERCLPSADVVLQWNQAVLAAVRADKPTIGFVTRDLAIVHTAIYDAVNAIDRTSGVFRVQANAPADASPVAAADAAGLFTASALSRPIRHCSRRRISRRWPTSPMARARPTGSPWGAQSPNRS